MKKKEKNGFLHFLEITAVSLIAIIITLVVLYSMNPQKLKESIMYISEKIQSAAENLYAGFKGQEKVEDNLEFPDEEALTEAQNYYYYQQLGNTAKKIYVSIEDNIEKLKNGEDNIPLPPSLNEDAKSNPDGKAFISSEFQNAWDAFITDKSEYFYIDSSKVCLVTKMTTKGSNTNYEFYIGKGNNENYFIDSFKTKEQVEKALDEIKDAKQDVLKNASGNNYEKMKYIHNWIIDNVKYDTANNKNNSNIYGCLVNKNVICEGYARTFKYLMDELDIPCLLVSGIAVDDNGKSERHAWNYVYIKNAWYAIDTTWDDPIIIGSGKVDDSIKYKYFLRGSDTMNKDHTTVGQITKNGYEFKYPDLSKEDIK